MYADHAATSHPVLFEAVPGYGNAAAGHRLGREACDAMDGARRSVAASLRLPLTGDVSRHIIVTSGGTEANNLIIQQPSWRYIVTLPTEHQAVYLAAQAVCADAACELVCLTPDGTGLVDLEELRAVLAEYAGRGPGLVSIAYVNNEIGVVQLFSRSSLGVLGCPGDCSSYPKGPLFDHSGSGGAANPLFESCPSRVSNSGLVGLGPTPSPLDWPLGRQVTISIGVPR